MGAREILACEIMVCYLIHYVGALIICCHQRMNGEMEINGHLHHAVPVETRELWLVQQWAEQKVQHLSMQLNTVQQEQWLEEDQLLFMMVMGPTTTNCGQGAVVCLDTRVECSWWVFELATGVVQLCDVLDWHFVDQIFESRMVVAERSHSRVCGAMCSQHWQ